MSIRVAQHSVTAATRPFGQALVTLYFFSGVTALAYEVLWARMLSLQFGVSIFGVVLTVAAFMLGLGVGSLLVARLLAPRPPGVKLLLLFAVLELSVAIFALLLPSVMSLLDSLITRFGMDSGLSAWYVFQAVVVIVVLFFPACALGATFPLVLRVLSFSTIKIGTVYGVNSMGGALGALLPLLLLPFLGWSGSNIVVATLGCGVAVAVTVLYILLSRRNNDNPRVAADEAQADVTRKETSRDVGSDKNEVKQDSLTAKASLSFWAYAGIGSAALALEISWTRLFGMILLRTEYVMAVILAVFLIGIALGSIIGKRLTASYWLFVFPPLAAFFILLSLWGLSGLAVWSGTASFASLSSAVAAQAGVIALLTLPTTFIFGAWFPLLAAYLQQSAGITAARLYGVNSVGAALGALLSGFVLVPWLGSTATICVTAAILLLCGVVWLQADKRGYYALAVMLLIFLALPVVELPPVNVLLPVSQRDTRDIYRYEDAVSITHVIEREDGQRLLLGDLQRLDASSEPSAVSSQLEQARLPLLLHPQPRSVLLLGVGTGISAAGSLPFPDLERTGVELSRGAIFAAQEFFTPVNLDVTQHMRVVRDDARRYLRRQGSQYDVIIGDLFHPDLVGRSALLSIQQFERARARLTENGLFVQWLALQQFDRQNLRVVLRTFKRVFPNALLFVDGFKLAMVGPAGEWPGVSAMLQNVSRLDERQRQQVTGAEGTWTRLGRYVGNIETGPGPIQDEWQPYIEFSLPRLRYARGIELVTLLQWLLDKRPDTNSAASALGVSEADFPAFERAYTATGLATMSWIAGLRGDQLEAQRLIRYANTINPADRLIALDLADKMYASLAQALPAGITREQALRRILEIRPDHEATLRDLWRLAVQQGDSGARRQFKQRLQAISPLSRLILPGL